MKLQFMETVISGNMGKRRNLKRRVNEVEGQGSGNDVTLSAVENERDSAQESDMDARKRASTRRENVNFDPLWHARSLLLVFRMQKTEMRTLMMCKNLIVWKY